MKRQRNEMEKRDIEMATKRQRRAVRRLNIMALSRAVESAVRGVDCGVPRRSCISNSVIVDMLNYTQACEVYERFVDQGALVKTLVRGVLSSDTTFDVNVFRGHEGQWPVIFLGNFGRVVMSPRSIRWLYQPAARAWARAERMYRLLLPTMIGDVLNIVKEYIAEDITVEQTFTRHINRSKKI